MGAWDKIRGWFGSAPAKAPELVPVTLQNWLGSDGYQSAFDPTKPAMELPIYGIPPQVIVASVAETLKQLEQGAFHQAAFLWDGMQRDDRVGAKLNERVIGLFGSKLDLLPGDESDEARAVKEKYEKRISKIFPSHQLKKLMRTGLGLSVGIAQVLSTRTTKTRDAQIRVWNNRHLRYDWLLRQYRLVTENRGEITIDPNDDEWVIYEPFGPHGWLDCALIRPLAAPWLIRHWTRTWWARRQEVHGSPIRAGIIPAERDPADERKFLSQLANLAHEATIRLPQGGEGNNFDVKLIEAAAGNVAGFERLLDHCDRSIEITFLGQSQSTEGQGGLGTQEKAGESTITRLLRGDAQVSEPLRERVLMPLVRDNEGNPELAPYLNWQLDPPEDLEQKSRALLNVAKSCLALRQAPEFMRHLDPRAVLDENQLPLVDEDQLPPTVPGAPQTQPSPLGDDDAEDGDEAVALQTVPADQGVQTGDATSTQKQGTAAATLALTATDIASIVTVDEGRKSIGLPPVGGDIGKKWIREHGAQLAAELPIAPVNDGIEEPDDNELSGE